MFNFAQITVEELKMLAPRVVLYTLVGYTAVRAATFVTARVSSLLGLDTKSS